MNMSAIETHVELAMHRRNLDDLPVCPLQVPDRFHLSWYTPGCEQWWREIHLVADRYTDVTEGLFREAFGDESEALAERMCFLRTWAGSAVGTATAWWGEEEPYREWGRLHWVAILPEFQRKGLAKPLVEGVCRRMRELGHRQAYLTTSSVRVPALNLYRFFGFEPLVRTDEERAAWFRLEPQLKLGLGRLADPESIG